MSLINKMLNKLGWTGSLLILLFLLFGVWGIFQRESLKGSAVYTKGIVEGTSFGSKGSKYLEYGFKANSENFKGTMPIAFCKKCINCCNVGDTVIVRYQKDNPENNDLVTELPEGAKFEDGN